MKGVTDMQTNKTEEEFKKEVDLTEEEIESYSGCSERTQRCLTDCPWPFPGSYINEASSVKEPHTYQRIGCAVSFLEERNVYNYLRSKSNL